MVFLLLPIAHKKKVFSLTLAERKRKRVNALILTIAIKEKGCQYAIYVVTPDSGCLTLPSQSYRSKYSFSYLSSDWDDFVPKTWSLFGTNWSLKTTATRRRKGKKENNNRKKVSIHRIRDSRLKIYFFAQVTNINCALADAKRRSSCSMSRSSSPSSLPLEGVGLPPLLLVVGWDAGQTRERNEGV